MQERSSESKTVFDDDITLPFRIVCGRKEASEDDENRPKDEEDPRVERAPSRESRE